MFLGRTEINSLQKSVMALIILVLVVFIYQGIQSLP